MKQRRRRRLVFSSSVCTITKNNLFFSGRKLVCRIKTTSRSQADWFGRGPRDSDDAKSEGSSLHTPLSSRRAPLSARSWPRAPTGSALARVASLLPPSTTSNGHRGRRHGGRARPVAVGRARAARRRRPRAAHGGGVAAEEVSVQRYVGGERGGGGQGGSRGAAVSFFLRRPRLSQLAHAWCDAGGREARLLVLSSSPSHLSLHQSPSVSPACKPSTSCAQRRGAHTRWC